MISLAQLNFYVSLGYQNWHDHSVINIVETCLVQGRCLDLCVSLAIVVFGDF